MRNNNNNIFIFIFIFIIIKIIKTAGKQKPQEERKTQNNNTWKFNTLPFRLNIEVNYRGKYSS